MILGLLTLLLKSHKHIMIVSILPIKYKKILFFLHWVQVRFWLYVLHLEKEKYDATKKDLITMYDMICTLRNMYRFKSGFHDRFTKFLSHMNSGTEWWNKTRLNPPPTKKERFMDKMFIYSILDFMRNCMFEAEEECPIDLVQLI